VNSVRLLLVAFLLVNAPNCHLSLVLSSIVQGDALKQVYHLTEKKYLYRLESDSARNNIYPTSRSQRTTSRSQILQTKTSKK